MSGFMVGEVRVIHRLSTIVHNLWITFVLGPSPRPAVLISTPASTANRAAIVSGCC